MAARDAGMEVVVIMLICRGWLHSLQSGNGTWYISLSPSWCQTPARCTSLTRLRSS